MCWRARASCCPAANQAIATLERYKARLDEVSNTLSALEIEDLVTVRDATIVLQRLEMVRRIADEIVGYVVELGTRRAAAGIAARRAARRRGHGPAADRAGLPAGRTPGRSSELVMVELAELSATDLLDLTAVARTLGFGGTPESLDAATSPRGYRLLSRVPRLPSPCWIAWSSSSAVSRSSWRRASRNSRRSTVWVRHGEVRAEAISRLADASIIDRYP
jgi:diadenylate cyclase